jgi:acetamidase/formamidase
VGALPADFEEPYVHYFRFDETRTHAEFVDGIRIPLMPSMGVYAVEPEGDEPVSAILAGAYGGNLDLWELTEGTSLFLPVFKTGARVWTGDANAAQCDGVVDQTGIESAMEELRVRYTVHKRVTLVGPTIETPTHWIVMAFADSLDTALPECVRTAIGWLSVAARRARRHAGQHARRRRVRRAVHPRRDRATLRQYQLDHPSACFQTKRRVSVQSHPGSPWDWGLENHQLPRRPG